MFMVPFTILFVSRSVDEITQKVTIRFRLNLQELCLNTGGDRLFKLSKFFIWQNYLI